MMERIKAFSKPAGGMLLLLFLFTLWLPADARDNSGVLKASDLIGMKVQGIDGKNLGTIKDLVIGKDDGDIQYGVLDFGGFAGIGDKYFAVPWEAFRLDQDNKKMALDLHKKDLKDAPGFDKNNWPDFSQDQIVIYEFYEIRPPSKEKTAQSVQ